MEILKELLLIDIVNNMSDNFEIIKEMDEETLIKNVDNFLTFWNIDSSNTNINQKRKLLKKIIKRLTDDYYHVEYCMNYTSDVCQLEDYKKRLLIDKQVIKEIKMYISCLSSIKNSIFTKKRKSNGTM